MPGRMLRPYEYDQIFLLPPSLREWLPADHPASFVADLDLTPIPDDVWRRDAGHRPL